GQYIEDHIIDGAFPSGSRILIDSSSWSYTNIKISSQNPALFICNTGSDPANPEIASANIQEESIDKSHLDAKQVFWLLFEKEKYKNILNNDKDMEKISDFGKWSLYQYLPNQAESDLISQ
ncbi:MAG: hypothetical protein GY869_31655, partial [Planctomycetes bacterium]|nr:hypothetical protein [Planctomycetota bacterium]